jgi:hypothetical protein
MSLWISVYCRKPIEKLRSSTLEAHQRPDAGLGGILPGSQSHRVPALRRGKSFSREQGQGILHES